MIISLGGVAMIVQPSFLFGGRGINKLGLGLAIMQVIPFLPLLSLIFLACFLLLVLPCSSSLIVLFFSLRSPGVLFVGTILPLLLSSLFLCVLNFLRLAHVAGLSLQSSSPDGTPINIPAVLITVPLARPPAATLAVPLARPPAGALTVPLARPLAGTLTVTLAVPIAVPLALPLARLAAGTLAVPLVGRQQCPQ